MIGFYFLHQQLLNCCLLVRSNGGNEAEERIAAIQGVMSERERGIARLNDLRRNNTLEPLLKSEEQKLSDINREIAWLESGNEGAWARLKFFVRYDYTNIHVANQNETLEC